MHRFAQAVALALIIPAGLFAEQPLVFNRSIVKEPTYQTKTPKYGMIAFGPEGKDRVWLVLDGDILYVDRNGNGDLTEAGEKLAPKKLARARTVSDGYTFEIGDLTIGGRSHKGFKVIAEYLSSYEGAGLGKTAEAKALMARDPKAMVLMILGDVDVVGIKGGRLEFMVGPNDLNGLLTLANKPANAPVVHLGGPVQITFYSELPTLRVGKSSEMVLVVGTPGQGKGTFAMLYYDETIPKTAKPMAEVTYQPAKPGEPPFKEAFEIKDRC